MRRFEIFKNSEGAISGWSSFTSVVWIAIIITASAQAWLCSVGRVPEALIAGIASLAVLVVCFSRIKRVNQVLEGSDHHIEIVLLIWFAITPVASFYIKYPSEQSILAFDRLAIAIAGVLWLFRIAGGAKQFRGEEVSGSVSRTTVLPITPFEVAWAVLTAVALINVLIRSHEFGYSLKVAVDSFGLPLIVFHLARNHFSLRRRGPALLLASIALAYFLLSCGVIELLTKTNLFPYKGSVIFREAEVRVNGPFASDSSYAIIPMLLGLFLLELPAMLKLRFDKSARLAYLVAVAAALLSACLPLYRVIPISIVVCILASSFLKRGSERVLQAESDASAREKAPGWNLRVLVLPSFIAALAVGGFYFVSSTNARLANPENAFSRLATWQAALKIAVDHPVSGVGLWNYEDYLRNEYAREDWSIEDALETRIATTPHSNPLWIAAELGVVGFVPYLLANFFLAMYGVRKLRSSSEPRTKTAAICYLSLLAAYWIPGLTLTSGSYSDLNLYFFFFLGLISGFLKKNGETDRFIDAL